MYVVKEGFTCGSMSSGKRVAFVTMIPFCVESSSFGNPWRFHSPMVVASVSMSKRFSFWEYGIFRFESSFFHASRSCVLKS